MFPQYELNYLSEINGNFLIRHFCFLVGTEWRKGKKQQRRQILNLYEPSNSTIIILKAAAAIKKRGKENSACWQQGDVSSEMAVTGRGGRAEVKRIKKQKVSPLPSKNIDLNITKEKNLHPGETRTHPAAAVTKRRSSPKFSPNLRASKLISQIWGKLRVWPTMRRSAKLIPC